MVRWKGEQGLVSVVKMERNGHHHRDLRYGVRCQILSRSLLLLLHVALYPIIYMFTATRAC
jgi:hypothetical protein